jgi:hypothetical protein
VFAIPVMGSTSIQHFSGPHVVSHVARFALVALLALALAPSALADPKQVKPDRQAINHLLDEFVPDVVEHKDLARGWNLVGPPALAVTHRQWLAGNSSVQTYPAKGKTFHGWIVNYSYPGDVGFDLLLQPTNPKMGAWSFRAEAQKIHGAWKITTWYPVAEFAPPGQTQRVNGPADLGAGGGSASASEARLGAWVLAIPAAVLGAIAVGVLVFATIRWSRRRKRVREIERLLASDR